MEQIASDIFDILKGANFKLRLFDYSGGQTVTPEDATRFYAYDQDFLVTLRIDDGNLEVLVQTGTDFNIANNHGLIKQIKQVAHNNLGEFTVRKFSKNIEPKDFSHQSVNESAYGKSYGSVKTSYVPFKESKLIIKHTKAVNEEKRGSRSRNIHSIFIESSGGERFRFPMNYLAGARAMAMHVSNGNTPYDQKGQSILSVCEEISDLTNFVKHVRSNKLMNENNSTTVEIVKERLASQKNLIKSLTTTRGYNNFEVQESEENIDVDITEDFMYNSFNTDSLNKVLSTVNRVVNENRKKDNMQKELLGKLMDIVGNGDLGLDHLDPNDPENPNNEDQEKYSGSQGIDAKLSSMLSYIAKRTKNDSLANAAAQMADEVHNKMPMEVKVALAKFVNFAMLSHKVKKEDTSTESVVESVENSMKSKISK